MEQKTIHNRHFTGEKEKWRTWSGKFLSRSGIKEYHVLLTGAKKILADNADKTK